MIDIAKKYKFRMGRLFFRNRTGEVIGNETMIPLFPAELLNHDGNLISRSCRDMGKSAMENLVRNATGQPEIVRVTYTGPEFDSNLTVKEWADQTLLWVKEKEAFKKLVSSLGRLQENTVKPLTEWKDILRVEMAKPEARKYFDKVDAERKSGVSVLPAPKEMLTAFRLTPFTKTKVVIIGQDPYPTKGHAHGLAFSCLSGVPASLRNIYTEICMEYHENRDWKYYFANGDLTGWAEQGVLLLNTTFSVRENEPNSHTDTGCESLVKNVLLRLTANRENLVFMLWGSKAKAMATYITGNQIILYAAHPSPMSAEKGGWFGNGHFTACNRHLEKHGLGRIEWIPPAMASELDDF